MLCFGTCRARHLAVLLYLARISKMCLACQYVTSMPKPQTMKMPAKPSLKAAITADHTGQDRLGQVVNMFL